MPSLTRRANAAHSAALFLSETSYSCQSHSFNIGEVANRVRVFTAGGGLIGAKEHIHHNSAIAGFNFDTEEFITS